VDKDPLHLVKQLAMDLKREDLRDISRIPEPRVFERYRDVLKKMYESMGICLPVVLIQFDDGTRRYYVFVVKAKIEDEATSYFDSEGTVDAYMVESGLKGVSQYEYRSLKFERAAEVLQMFDEVGDKFRDAELRLVVKKAVTEPYVFFY